mmetsp:Transcript_45434/g.116257  ORF Transcript_45434/g.116257 Transcript_45434/m.116257 type:complete len:267 (+) Transcript_45434:398-1198(+)
MMPVTPAASVNSLAWFVMLRPVVPSRTKMTSCGAPSQESSTAFLQRCSSSIKLKLLCSRPDVSQMTMSVVLSFTACVTAAAMTSSGFIPSLNSATVAVARLDHSASCSTAAARNVSPAARRTFSPASPNLWDSLPTVVVFPLPFTPMIRITEGLESPSCSEGSPPRVSSMSLMDFFRALRMSSPVLSSPSMMRLRMPSTTLNAVFGPKSAVISKSSSSSSVSSVSSRFQKVNSSSNTPRRCLVLLVPLNTRSASATAFSFSTRMAF